MIIYKTHSRKHAILAKLLGFTLLELLIAISIFAVLSTISYTGLNSVLKTREITAQEAEKLHKLQMTITFIQRDISQISNISIRDEFGDIKPAIVTEFSDDHIIEFTRNGWRNPTAQLRSTIQRVAYGVEEDKLYREYWVHANRGPQEKPLRATLMSGLDHITFEFQDDNKNWHDSWPPLNTSASNLPTAVKVTFELEDGNEFFRLFYTS